MPSSLMRSAHFQALLLKLDLTPEEQKELQKVLWEKIK